ncbi:MAG TPA: ABC transporter permease [Puia sp.]|nr:ABC transporter permease [Puia sp.]
MIRSYFTIAWRSLLRNRRFTLINISGLTLGIACSMLILLWVHDERSVDSFHKNGSRLYQVYERDYFNDHVMADYPTPALLADELKRTIPDVQYASAMDADAPPGAGNTLGIDDKIIKMNGVFVGQDFLRMFNFPLVQGQVATALAAPGTIAISRKAAGYFFGSPQAAIGKVLTFDNKQTLQVSAVFEDVPGNSSLQFDFLRPWADFVKQNDWVSNWGDTDPQTFVQLRPGADPARVNAVIRDFVYRYRPRTEGARTELALQPFPERYLHSSFRDGQLSGGRIQYVRLFTLVAIFILLIACINFMNLATAQSARRAKEVGLRKVIGAVRTALVAQFIGEAMLLTLVSVGLALLVTYAALPAFNALTGKHLLLPVARPLFWLVVACMLLITGLVAGSYPAFFLSGLQPVKILKGGLKFTRNDVFFRKCLVVFQFSLSVILIVSTMVIYRQTAYIRSTNIGYDRENLVYIPIEGDLVGNYELFRREAKDLPGILGVSKMRNSPTDIEHHTGDIFWPGKDPNLHIRFADGVVGYDFTKTLKLQMKAGRDFSRDYPSDSTGFLLNETAVRIMGLRQPVGSIITWGMHPGKVIGVIKDFHFNSLHQRIDPLIVRLDERWTWGNILVRTKAGLARQAVTGLGKLCKELNPKFPFTYQFADEEFNRQYRSDEVVSQLSDIFASLAIFISCLGLLGLAAFTAAQRTREIGVRKVLGATATSIVTMLSRDFLVLVLLALLIASPVAWLAMRQWLGNFAYRIDIGWWTFGVAGLAVISIAVLTVAWQTLRAALTNPVHVLRNE